jgi:hypothetical protein
VDVRAFLVRRGRVARLADGSDERFLGDPVVPDVGLVSREVDVGFDHALDLSEGALDPADAGRAGHALDVESRLLGRCGFVLVGHRGVDVGHCST